MRENREVDDSNLTEYSFRVDNLFVCHLRGGWRPPCQPDREGQDMGQMRS
ncbi:hypothetical protein ACFOWZ_16600 [Lentzea rhizosphaerae]|uniref:Uncharacterized protein n=1 Tax=Lentzea rhizosphaerae TaxID=2041025 RepID=A0ABV8BRT1_9PSEU